MRNNSAADLLTLPPLSDALESIRETAALIQRYAHYAKVFRQLACMRCPASAQIFMPRRDYQMTGRHYLDPYYLGDGLDPVDLFENISEVKNLLYRVQVLQSLAAIQERMRSIESAAALMIDAMKISPTVEIFKRMPLIQSFKDPRDRVIAEVERILSMAWRSDPLDFNRFLNSLMPGISYPGPKIVERGIVGPEIASAPAEYYSIWGEGPHVENLNRSFVSIGRPLLRDNVIPFDRHRRRPLSQRQLLIRIVALASTQRLPERALYEIDQIVRSYAADAVYDAECY